jgi:hypothetical protein
MTEQSTETRLALLEDSIPRIEANTAKILIILEGKGDSPGLKGKVEVNKSSIKRIWWAFGIGGGSFLSSVIAVLVRLF